MPEYSKLRGFTGPFGVASISFKIPKAVLLTMACCATKLDDCALKELFDYSLWDLESS